VATSYRVAVVKWSNADGIAYVIGDELARLGHQPVPFKFDEAVPEGVDVVFSFAPYGEFLQIPLQLNRRNQDRRPVLIHWNTEGIPNPRLPWPLLAGVGLLRSWFGRLAHSERGPVRALINRPPLCYVNRKLHRFRFLGDNIYAYRRGWLHVLAEYSQVYTNLYRQHGIPAFFVPWGTHPSWYADLQLERDIDVFWMGTWRTRRRARLLHRVCKELEARGVCTYIADNVEHPFVFGETRTRFLNRAKITLNLLPTVHDNNFPHRFHMAAGNRSLVVSEPLWPHCPAYRAGQHYVAAAPEALVETIVYYLTHDDERRAIVENAYQLATQEMTLARSIRSIMEEAHARLAEHLG